MRTGISHVTIMGAGLSGLTLAWKLQEAGLQTLVLEGQPQIGGLTKSKVWQGFRFEIGPDSFYTEEQPILQELTSLMGQVHEFRPRKHRIWFGGRWISYPLSPASLLKVPTGTLLKGMKEFFGAWGRRQLEFPISLFYRLPAVPIVRHTPPSEQLPQYGELVDQLLMKEYLFKIRQHPSHSLRPAWSTSPEMTTKDSVRQMFQGLLSPPESTAQTFHDPKRGFGSIASQMCDEIKRMGGDVKTSVNIRRISAPNEEVQSVDYAHNSREHLQPTDYIFSTIPLPNLLTLLDPLPEHALIESSIQLRHHVMLHLCILLRRPATDKHWWSYFPEQEVPFFRVCQAVPHMPMQTQPQHQTCLVVEWILSRHHPLAEASEEELFQAALPGLKAAGFPTDPVQDLMVHRERQALPMFDERAQQTMRSISGYVTRIRRLRSMGQRGSFTPSHLSQTLYDALQAAEQLSKEASRIRNAPSQTTSQL